VKTRGRRPLPSPELIYSKLSLRHHCLTTSSLVVYVSLEDSPSTWRLTGSTLPSCGSAASRFSVEGRVTCYRPRETSLRLRSTSEYDLVYPHHRNDACSLEVFCPFNVTQPVRATNPGHSKPGSCCVLPLTMRFDALLPKRPPRCLSTGYVHGVHFPSELDLTEIIRSLDRDIPSCD